MTNIEEKIREIVIRHGGESPDRRKYIYVKIHESFQRMAENNHGNIKGARVDGLRDKIDEIINKIEKEYIGSFEVKSENQESEPQVLEMEKRLMTEENKQAGGSGVIRAAAAIIAVCAVAGGAWYVMQPKGPADAVPPVTSASKVVAPATESGNTLLQLTGPQMELSIVDGNTVVRTDGGLLIASTRVDPPSGGWTGGAYYTVAPDIEKSVAGKSILVEITARKAASGPASGEFAVAYSTASVGNSGWRKFTPEEGFKTFSFTYDVPPLKDGVTENDYIGVWADTAGQGGAIEVSQIRISTANQ